MGKLDVNIEAGCDRRGPMAIEIWVAQRMRVKNRGHILLTRASDCFYRRYVMKRLLRRQLNIQAKKNDNNNKTLTSSE